MRIYALTPSFPPGRGGQEIHLQELATSLIAAGMSVRVLAAARDSPPAEYVDAVPVIRLYTFGPTQGSGWLAIPLIAFLLCRVVWRLWHERNQYDLILVSGFNILPLAAVAGGMLTRKQCVVRPESPVELVQAVGASSGGKKIGGPGFSVVIRLAERLRHFAARRVDMYVAISSEIRAGLTAMRINPERIVDIPNGISTELFQPASAARRAQLRTRLGLPHDGRLVVYTGRLAVSKGVMMLLEAFAELAPRFPQAHLILVGTGAGSSDDCEPAARNFIVVRALTGQVTFTGSVANVQEYLQAADIFAFPSDYEGFGLSIIEAMAVGLPMVCTRVGVAVDLAGDTEVALLVPPKDRFAFTAALERLLADEELRTLLSARARDCVAARFSMDAVARQYCETFYALLQRRL